MYQFVPRPLAHSTSSCSLLLLLREPFSGLSRRRLTVIKCWQGPKYQDCRPLALRIAQNNRQTHHLSQSHQQQAHHFDAKASAKSPASSSYCLLKCAKNGLPTAACPALSSNLPLT